jgi:hypothetical protein
MTERISSLRELKRHFDEGILSEEDGDVILFDKSTCELYTEKPYHFAESYADVAWEAMDLLGIHASGV